MRSEKGMVGVKEKRTDAITTDEVNNGTDYGTPRFGMNTFDFIMLTLPKQEKVTSKICFTDENGKQVCQ
jgi:hypothetical protein